MCHQSRKRVLTLGIRFITFIYLSCSARGGTPFSIEFQTTASYLVLYHQVLFQPRFIVFCISFFLFFPVSRALLSSLFQSSQLDRSLKSHLISCFGDLALEIGSFFLPSSLFFFFPFLHFPSHSSIISFFPLFFPPQSSQVDRSLKPHLISCFGDLALAIGPFFERYLGYLMPMMKEASTIVLETSTVRGRGRHLFENRELREQNNKKVREGESERSKGAIQ